MKKLSRKPMRMILANLLLLLILTLALFGAQTLASSQASARAPDLINIELRAAIMGGEQLLLMDTLGRTIYLPTIYK